MRSVHNSVRFKSPCQERRPVMGGQEVEENVGDMGTCDMLHSPALRLFVGVHTGLQTHTGDGQG